VLKVTADFIDDAASEKLAGRRKESKDARRDLMRILFVHQNVAGQYVHLARYLGATPGNEVFFITQRQGGRFPA
jgi:hypothetical protein